LAFPCEVDVWLISLLVERETVLAPDEEIRASRFHFGGDRTRWTRAHSALRGILSTCTNTPALDLAFVTGPHGKPSLSVSSGIEFNLSHAGDWALVAVTTGYPVGVDIERAREGVDLAALLRRLGETDLPENQDELLRAWTRREAKSKAAGGALFDRHELDFRVCDLDAPAGYAASVALIGRDPVVRLREAPRSLVLPSSTH
jgi:4'-phosphopantetheinyl transferase